MPERSTLGLSCQGHRSCDPLDSPTVGRLCWSSCSQSNRRSCWSSCSQSRNTYFISRFLKAYTEAGLVHSWLRASIPRWSLSTVHMRNICTAEGTIRMLGLYPQFLQFISRHFFFVQTLLASPTLQSNASSIPRFSCCCPVIWRLVSCTGWRREHKILLHKATKQK